MFQNRLLKLKTELPTAEELESWLVDRCEDWGIQTGTQGHWEGRQKEQPGGWHRSPRFGPCFTRSGGKASPWA